MTEENNSSGNPEPKAVPSRAAQPASRVIKAWMTVERRVVENNECGSDFSLETLSSQGRLGYLVFTQSDKSFSLQEDLSINRVEYSIRSTPSIEYLGVMLEHIEAIKGLQENLESEAFREAFFDKVLDAVKEYVCLENEADYTLSAAWILHTYFYDCFSETPYLLAYGATASGKSQLIKLASRLGYRGTYQGHMSLSSMYTLSSRDRGTMCYDEAEDLARNPYSDKYAIVNNGYEKGGTVVRTDFDNNKEEKRTPERLNAFCPKAFASIEPFTGPLATRCIRLTLYGSGGRYGSPLKIPEENEIRSTATVCRLIHWPHIEKLGGEIEAFTDRDSGLAKPLLAMMHFFKPSDYEVVKARLEELFNEGKDYEGDLAYSMAMVLKEYLGTPGFVTVEELTTKLNAYESGDNHLANNQVGIILKREGFKPEKRKGQRGYVITDDKIRRMLRRYRIEVNEEE